MVTLTQLADGGGFTTCLPSLHQHKSHKQTNFRVHYACTGSFVPTLCSSVLVRPIRSFVQILRHLKILHPPLFFSQNITSWRSLIVLYCWLGIEIGLCSDVCLYVPGSVSALQVLVQVLFRAKNIRVMQRGHWSGPPAATHSTPDWNVMSSSFSFNYCLFFEGIRSPTHHVVFKCQDLYFWIEISVISVNVTNDRFKIHLYRPATEAFVFRSVGGAHILTRFIFPMEWAPRASSHLHQWPICLNDRYNRGWWENLRQLYLPRRWSGLHWPGRLESSPAGNSGPSRLPQTEFSPKSDRRCNTNVTWIQKF